MASNTIRSAGTVVSLMISKWEKCRKGMNFDPDRLIDTRTPTVLEYRNFPGGGEVPGMHCQERGWPGGGAHPARGTRRQAPG